MTFSSLVPSSGMVGCSGLKLWPKFLYTPWFSFLQLCAFVPSCSLRPVKYIDCRTPASNRSPKALPNPNCPDV